MKENHVVIAGAGPAGCSAAIILGEKGFNVHLIDKDDFPREKTCGDGITYKALPLLKRLKVFQNLKKQNVFSTNGYTLVFRDNTELVFRKPSGDKSFAYIIKRYEFDNVLLKRALSFPSVTFQPKTKVKGLLYEGSKIVGVKTNKGDVKASIVMDGSGVNSILGREIGRGNRDPKSCALAVRGYYEGVKGLSNTIEVYFSDDILPGYFWIFPTSEHTANIGGGTFQNIVDEKKIDLKELLLNFVAYHPVASKKLKDSKLKGILKGGKIPLAYGDFGWSRVHDNLLLLGDAGGFVNPITAEGISYAMQTGIYAADVVANALTNNHTDLEKYNELWLKTFSAQYKTGDLYNDGVPSGMIQKYVMGNLDKSIDKVDLKSPAESYEYLVKLKVLSKAF